MKKATIGLNEKMYFLMEGTSDAILTTDPHYIITDINQRGMDMYGYSGKEGITGHSLFELFPQHSRQKAKEYITENPEHIDAANGRYLFLKADKSEFYGKMKVVSLHGEVSGRLDGLLLIVTDITGQMRLKQALRRYNRDITNINKISQSLSGLKDLGEVTRKSLDILLNALNLHSGVLYLLHESNGSLMLNTDKGFNIEFAKMLNVLFENDRVTTRAKETIRTITTSDLIRDKTFQNSQNVLQSTNIKYLVMVYLESQGRTIGLVCAAANNLITLSPEDLLWLKTLSGQIGIAIKNAAELQKTSSQSITDELTELYNRRHFVRSLETEIYRSQRYGWPVSLVILDIDHLKLANDRFGHIAGDELLKSLADTMRLKSRKSDIAFRLGGDEFAIILPNASSTKAREIINRIRANWIQKKRAQNVTTGVRVGFSSGIAEYPENAGTQDSLTFLADAALYYSKRKGRHKTTLVSELKSVSAEDSLSKSILDQVYALSTTVETKEAFGFGHFSRVAETSEMISKSLGLPPNEIEDIKAAALLHDIGKIGIPNEILTKPSDLTPKEREIIKKHATEGAKIISQIGRIANLAPVILHHHERYDGQGYPDKLKGEDIPLGARIICLADAYDSMVTARPYKKIISREDALQELQNCSGSQFDPRVVQALVTVMRDRGPK